MLLFVKALILFFSAPITSLKEAPMSQELEVLQRVLVGKKIVGVEVDPTTSSFIHHHSGRLTLTLESGETILFQVGDGYSPRVEAVINGKETIRT